MLKDFLQSKQAKRAYWAMINVAMGLALSFITFAASENLAWAGMLLMPFTAFSQWFTKEIIAPKLK